MNIADKFINMLTAGAQDDSKVPTEFERTTILENSVPSFAFEIQNKILDGWTLDEENYPVQLGFMFEATFVRFVEKEQEPVKLSREEALAKARSVMQANRAAKKAAKEAKEND